MLENIILPNAEQDAMEAVLSLSYIGASCQHILHIILCHCASVPQFLIKNLASCMRD